MKVDKCRYMDKGRFEITYLDINTKQYGATVFLNRLEEIRKKSCGHEKSDKM